MKKPSADHPLVSMVQVVLDVHDDGTVSVSVDHEPLAPAPGSGVWRRGDFAQIIDAASKERAVPVRVTVHEADGTSFTDILPAVVRRASEPEAAASLSAEVPAEENAADADHPVEVRVTGVGFLPGEDIAVALVAVHTDATPTGDARVLLDPGHIAALAAGEVVFFGRASGTITVRSLR
ncbi:hypothetical protein I6G59_16935 [Brevibacterium casei]|uniref:Uncharacterized protein n=2 Tax=Brevibacterium casei TaxID=33889 RepID=A0A7T2TH07_9MICO|nr:hypothetical protein I6G59_16935 [Brevibacterium casei]